MVQAEKLYAVRRCVGRRKRHSDIHGRGESSWHPNVRTISKIWRTARARILGVRAKGCVASACSIICGVSSFRDAVFRQRRKRRMIGRFGPSRGHGIYSPVFFCRHQGPPFGANGRGDIATQGQQKTARTDIGQQRRNRVADGDLWPRERRGREITPQSSDRKD